MKTNFQLGDICKTRTEGTTVLVIEYKVNHAGAILNHFSRENKFPERVLTDDVLCEFEVKGEVKRRYFKEANLELISRPS